MGRQDLMTHLSMLRDLILAEREAAKDLAMDKLLVLAAEKEILLKEIIPLSETAGQLTDAEKEMSEAVYSENLRNAYFLWSALKWVRASMEFMGDKIYPDSYEESGSMVKVPFSGALLSGRF